MQLLCNRKCPLISHGAISPISLGKDPSRLKATNKNFVALAARKRSRPPGPELGGTEPISLLLNHLSGASPVLFLFNHVILG